MTYRQLRRATATEKAQACFIRHIDVDSIAEAWIDDRGRVELVLLDFENRVSVNIANFHQEETHD